MTADPLRPPETDEEPWEDFAIDTAPSRWPIVATVAVLAALTAVAVAWRIVSHD